MYNVTYRGKIEFEPEPLIKKHQEQSAWKKTALVLFDGDLCEYYSWFLKKRFNLILKKPHRGPHVTFIADRLSDFNNNLGSLEEKQQAWDKIKTKYDGTEVDVVLNTRPFTDTKYWWLIVDHLHRGELHSIREEAGLGKPFFGLHMTIGDVNEKNMFHSEYINELAKSNLILLNQDYTK